MLRRGVKPKTAYQAPFRPNPRFGKPFQPARTLKSASRAASGVARGQSPS